MSTFKRFWKEQICAGDLRHLITFESRVLDEPGPLDVEASMTFTLIKAVSAAIRTTSGVPKFDKINIEVLPTHLFAVFFDPDLTELEHSNTFVGLANRPPDLAKVRRFRVLNVEAKDEDQEYLIVAASERGNADFKASEA